MKSPVTSSINRYPSRNNTVIAASHRCEQAASFHSDLLIHGSSPNQSERRRCGLTLRYCPADVVAHLGWNRKGVVVAKPSESHELARSDSSISGLGMGRNKGLPRINGCAEPQLLRLTDEIPRGRMLGKKEERRVKWPRTRPRMLLNSLIAGSQSDLDGLISRSLRSFFDSIHPHSNTALTIRD